jgi:hypothetical protein
MPHNSHSKELWNEARAAYLRMAAISRESKEISAKMRLVDVYSDTYSTLHQAFNDQQIEWHQAFRTFSAAQSEFTAHIREVMFSGADFRSLCESVAGDVENGSKPAEISISFHKPIGFPLRVGPAPWFHITGGCIHQGPQDETVGTYENNAWLADGQHFTSCNVLGPAVIQLDGGQCEVLGPFDFVLMAGRAIECREIACDE